MAESPISTVVAARPTHRRIPSSRSNSLQAASTAIAAAALLAFGFMSAPPMAVQARDGLPSGQKDQAPDPANPAGFAAEIRRTLKELHDRMIGLAEQLIERVEVPGDLEGQLAIQPTRIKSAQASLKSAELAREAAEIAVAEFEKGTVVQEEAAAEEELKLARRDLERLRWRIPQSKDRRLQIEQAAKGSNVDLAPLLIAELEEKNAGFVTELAESKRKILFEYTKPTRLKELRAAVEKAKADGLAARARWQLEQAKLRRLQQVTKAREVGASASKARNPHDRQALAALDRAIPTEEQLRAKLDQLSKDGKPDDRLRQEIHDLTNQVGLSSIKPTSNDPRRDLTL